MSPTPSSRIALLFLSAGASRRMGRSKALLPWHGKSVVAHHFATLKTIPHLDPWIVMKPADQPLHDELDRCGWPTHQRLTNPDAPDCDMTASIQIGLAGILAADTPYQTIGIALIDQPSIHASTYRKLADACRVHPQTILQPECDHRRGHPVMLPRFFAETYLNATPPTFRHFLETHESARSTVRIEDPGILQDMDTPQAYNSLLQATGEKT